MNRYIVFAALGAASVAGYTALHGKAFAQSSAAKGNEPPRVAIFTIDGSKYPRAENGKATIWTAEELKKKYVDDPNGPTNDHIEWAPPYRITVQRRKPSDAATVGGELHEDKTQIYVIMAGTGTVLLGGKPKADTSAGPGEHRSQLIGATPHAVKPGDVISIPPMTWHAAFADPGQQLTFMMFHIENRQTIP
jgi:mannose-6-phosphate isomerase-like protein (cupin superfamily)